MPSRVRVYSEYGRWLVVALLLSLFAFSAFAAEDLPSYNSPVMDYAGVLSSGAKQQLESKILDYRRQSTNEIGVLIVKSLDNNSLEDYAHDAFAKWGIGKKGKDNGVLFVVSIDDRKARIEVGYGLEGQLTDLQAGRLVNRNSAMATHFRQGDYDGGVAAVVDGVIASIAGEYKPPPEEDHDDKGAPFPMAAGFILFAVIMGLLRSFGRFRRGGWWYGGPFGGGFSGGSFGGGGSSGFSFGGGSSGGGGASGGW